MRAAPGWAERLLLAWDWVERGLVGVLGLAAIVVGVAQVLGRYLTPRHAIGYAEELIVYLLIWAVMISSSQLVRLNGHVRPDLVLRAAPAPVQRWLEVFNCLVALGFSVGLACYGWQVVDTALLLDEHSSTDLQFPMWAYYLALPVGGGLMAVRYALRLIRLAVAPASLPETGRATHEALLDAPPPTAE